MAGTKGRSGRPPKIIGRPSDSEEDRVRLFKDFVYMQAMGGKNVAYARLYADMNGLIQQRTEKKEERGINADEIAQAIEKVGRSGKGPGVGEMPKRSRVLRRALRDDTRPGEGTDTLRAISPPDEPLQRDSDASPDSDSEG